MFDQPIHFSSSTSNLVFGKPGCDEDDHNIQSPPAGCASGRIENLAEAEQLIAYAGSTLGQIISLLTGIEETTRRSSEVTQRDSVESFQIQIDGYLDALQLAITSSRVAINSSSSAGLFDGYFDFSHTASSIAQVVDCQVFRADLDATGDKTISVSIQEEAKQAEITANASAFADGLSGNLVFELAGSQGAETFTFEAGTSAAHIVAMVNLFCDRTGVSARLAEDGGILFQSNLFGTLGTIHISVFSEPEQGTFQTSLSSEDATGSDVVATINELPALGLGNSLRLQTSQLDLTLTLQPGVKRDFEFTVTGGGIQFDISGVRSRIGILSLLPSMLGGPSGRLYELTSGQAKSLENDAELSSAIASESIERATQLQDRLLAFHENLVVAVEEKTAVRPTNSQLSPHIQTGQPTARPIVPKAPIVDEDQQRVAKIREQQQVLVQPGSVLQMAVAKEDIFLRR